MHKYKEDSDCSVVIIASADQHNYIKSVLRDYKLRYNHSLADRIGVTDTLDELPFDTTVILPEYMSISVNGLRFSKLVTVDAIQNLSHHDLRRATIETHVEVITDLEVASDRLQLLGPLFSFDTETAPAVENELLTQKDLSLDVFRNQVTMYSFAEDEENAFVIINEDQAMEDMVMDFLTSTESTVVMHNASFDMKIVKHRTGKFIKNIEDTQLLAWSYLNHADAQKAKVGLKHLAKVVYSSWAISADLFGIEHKYNPDLHEYSGIDAIATMWLWNEYSAIDEEPPHVPLEDLLPIPEPRYHEETPRFFYQNVVKPMIQPAITMMLNGIQLDMEKVDKLDIVLQDILADVDEKLQSSPLIQKFQSQKVEAARTAKVAHITAKKKDIRTFLRDYKHTDTVMRSYVVNEYLKIFEDRGFTFDLSFWPADVLPDQTTKWTLNDVKKMRKVNTLPLLDEIIDKSIDPLHDIVVRAMIKLATYKMNMQHNKCEDEISEIGVVVKPFSPASNPDMRNFFEMVEVEPLAYSKKTGNASWGREQLEDLQKITTDQQLLDVLEPLVTFSQSSIVKTNFINGFRKFNIDGVLHGNFKLCGAKSARPTSNKINLLNMPSTGSVYAKPIKECLKPFPGELIYAIDLSALEDRVIASLSHDKNKCAIFTDGLDGHSLNACGYFPEKLEPILGKNENNVEYVKRFMKLVDEGNKEIKTIRQESKGPTFALAYGAYPPKIAASVKCTLDEAQSIFDNYHNNLYHGISDYRENYVHKSATEKGYLHLLLGLRMLVDDVDRDIRTITNATVQSFSLLTLIAKAIVEQKLDTDNMRGSIRTIATIYDSIYYSVKPDASVIEWLNDTVVPAMTQPYLIGEEVSNEAEGEIGTDFANLVAVPNNADTQQIKEIIDGTILS